MDEGFYRPAVGSVDANRLSRCCARDVECENIDAGLYRGVKCLLYKSALPPILVSSFILAPSLSVGLVCTHLQAAWRHRVTLHAARGGVCRLKCSTPAPVNRGRAESAAETRGVKMHPPRTGLNRAGSSIVATSLFVPIWLIVGTYADAVQPAAPTHQRGGSEGFNALYRIL